MFHIEAAEQLLDAYKAAMSSKDRSIAQQAISYLPQFVSVALGSSFFFQFLYLF